MDSILRPRPAVLSSIYLVQVKYHLLLVSDPEEVHLS